MSFPINSMVIFHSYVNVYQRVCHGRSENTMDDSGEKNPCRTPQNKASQLGFQSFMMIVLPEHADWRQENEPNSQWTKRGSCTKPGGKSQGFADTKSQALTVWPSDLLRFKQRCCGQNLCTEHFMKTLEICCHHDLACIQYTYVYYMIS